MGRGVWWATVQGVAKSRTRLSDFSSLHPTVERKGFGCACLPTPQCLPILTGSSFRPSRVRNRENDISGKGIASLGRSIFKASSFSWGCVENSCKFLIVASTRDLQLQPPPPHAFIISSLASYFQYFSQCHGQLLVLSLFGDYLLHWAVISEGSKMAPGGSLLRKHTVHSLFNFQHCNCWHGLVVSTRLSSRDKVWSINCALVLLPQNSNRSANLSISLKFLTRSSHLYG